MSILKSLGVIFQTFKSIGINDKIKVFRINI